MNRQTLVHAGAVCLALVLFLLGLQFPHLPKVDDDAAIAATAWLAEDPGATLDVAEVAAGALEFAPLRASRKSLGATGSAFWLRIRVDNPEPVAVTRWLTVGIPRLHYVSLFDAHEGEWQAHHSGMGVPFAHRDAPTVTPVFALDLPAHSSREVLVRVASETLLLIQPRLWPPLDFLIAEGRQVHQEYFAAGATLLVVVICVLLAIMLRETSFVVFGAMAASYLLFRWSASGLAFAELWPESPGWAVRAIGFFMALIGLLMVVLHRQMLETARRLPRMNRVLGVLAAGFAVLGVLSLIDPSRHTTMALMLWGLGLSVLTPVLGYMAWRRGAPLFGYFFAGYALPWHLIEVQYFASMGWLPRVSGWLIDYNRTWALLLSATIVMVALGERITRMRREREQSERLRVEELEAAVAQRTAALNQAHQVAEGALADQRRLLAMASHEIRGPLANISAAAQLLELDCRTQERRQVLERITRATSRLAGFLDNCLTSERVATGGWVLNEARIAVSPLLQETADDMKHVSPTHHFSVTTASYLPELRGDPQLLRALLRNLLENAVKYSPPESVIELGAKLANDGRMIVSVADQGIGIAPDELERVYDKFYRSQRTGSVSGAGLGLYIVKRIATLHDADIVTHSSRRSGTRVVLILPQNRLYA